MDHGRSQDFDSGEPFRPRGVSGWGSPTGRRRIFENFLKKIDKMHYFGIFFKYLTKYGLIFRMFGRKTHCCKILRKFENFDENSI